LPKKQLSEAERAKLLKRIEQVSDTLNLEEALDYLAESKKDKPLPFRD
jgi:hypothetical protein